MIKKNNKKVTIPKFSFSHDVITDRPKRFLNNGCFVHFSDFYKTIFSLGPVYIGTYTHFFKSRFAELNETTFE